MNDNRERYSRCLIISLLSMAFYPRLNQEERTETWFHRILLIYYYCHLFLSRDTLENDLRSIRTAEKFFIYSFI